VSDEKKYKYRYCTRATSDEAGSGPVLTQLKARLGKVKSEIPAKPPLAKAKHYTPTQGEALVRQVGDGRIKFDNNAIEREYARAQGLKNQLFAS